MNLPVQVVDNVDFFYFQGHIAELYQELQLPIAID